MSGRTRRKRDEDNDKESTDKQESDGKSQTRSRSRNNRRPQRWNERQRARSENGREDQEQAEQRRPVAREVFDPAGAARVGLLRLARKWSAAGNMYAAIHAYEQLLVRYGGTSAGNTAAEELIELAEALEDSGQYYTALNILNKVEQLA